MELIYAPQQALQRLISGNQIYLRTCRNPADISPKIRRATAQHGQRPFAAVLSCSDSRVPPEHIFSAGIGELFAVRTAGNAVGDLELGSLEYAAQHLHIPLITIMGHTRCGAVEAAMNGCAHGYIRAVVHEIQLGLDGATTEGEAIRNNILHSGQRVMQSEMLRAYREAGQLMVVCAEYDIETGAVRFFDGC